MSSTTRICLAAISLMLVCAACSVGDSNPSTTISAIETTGTEAPTAPAATTTPTTTDSTAASTTTIPATTTTPPTTAVVTTTTATEPAATTTTLSETYFYLELRPDGLGDADFGDDEASTIAYVTDVIGAPASDTGWVDSFANFGVCPSASARVVSWTSPGKFDLYFFEAGTTFASDGVRHFGHYWYHGPDLNAFGVYTPDGVTVGSTVLTLNNAYGVDLEISESFIPGAYFWRVDTNPTDSSALGGWTTGDDDSSILESIYGGLGCGE
jgi:hypothetical protein